MTQLGCTWPTCANARGLVNRLVRRYIQRLLTPANGSGFALRRRERRFESCRGRHTNLVPDLRYAYHVGDRTSCEITDVRRGGERRPGAEIRPPSPEVVERCHSEADSRPSIPRMRRVPNMGLGPADPREAVLGRRAGFRCTGVLAGLFGREVGGVGGAEVGAAAAEGVDPLRASVVEALCDEVGSVGVPSAGHSYVCRCGSGVLS
jgi:hypothetical protein